VANVLVTQIGLNRPGIHAIVGHLEAAGVAEHVPSLARTLSARPFSETRRPVGALRSDMNVRGRPGLDVPRSLRREAALGLAARDWARPRSSSRRRLRSEKL
jgi:hypothetical protein